MTHYLLFYLSFNELILEIHFYVVMYCAEFGSLLLAYASLLSVLTTAWAYLDRH
jgi:hypothetical protein